VPRAAACNCQTTVGGLKLGLGGVCLPGAPLSQVILQDVQGGRCYGYQNDDDDDRHQVAVGGLAQEVARAHHARCPEQSTEDVEAEEAPVVHRADTCHYRCEGAHDGHEAGQHNDLAAVLFVERFGLIEVFLLEEEGVLALEESPSHPAAEPVADAIARYRSDETANRQDRIAQLDAQGILQALATGDDARCEEQAVAGQEETHQQARLGEDNGENAKVTNGGDEVLEVEADQFFHGLCMPVA